MNDKTTERTMALVKDRPYCGRTLEKSPWRGWLWCATCFK